MALSEKKEKSPVIEELQDIVEKPNYSEEEQKYIQGLRKRMEEAQEQRDKGHNEFDGMDYITYYESNEFLANTFVKPKINKEDSNFQSGVIRQKLFALLSALLNLDLKGDISAFDKNGFNIQSAGDAMEDIILKTDELDNDDEKKYLRQYELLKQGTVFVEELWDEKNQKKKKVKKEFDGKFKGFDYTEEVKKAFARPTREIVCGLNVYLGSMRIYDISDQPFIFTADIKPYEEVKAMFRDWDRWNNVPKKLQKFNPDQKEGLFNYDWNLLQSKEGYVEILRYQDKWNNEYALFLNGVLMTPIGMPLPWGYEEYNISQQNLEPINAKFAYGKCMVARLKNKVALLDEFLKLGILKTQKSFMPPYLNVSGRVVSNRVFMPGKISYGIPPGTLIPVSDKETQGVTNSELNMIKEIQTSIDQESVAPVFQGQQAEGSPTATEIIELQRQAKMVLGITIFAMAMLEWKLQWLRLKNILAHWFEPEDEAVDKMRGEIRKVYRRVTTQKLIEKEGIGRQIVIPTDTMPSSTDIMKVEDRISKEQGMPVRFIFLNPEEIKSAKNIWQIVIKPKEKKTSELNKLMFRAFMEDIMPLQPNIEYIREKAASVWEENPSKLFSQTVQPPEGQGMAGALGMSTKSPRVSLPQAGKAVNNQLNRSMQNG